MLLRWLLFLLVPKRSSQPELHLSSTTASPRNTEGTCYRVKVIGSSSLAIVAAYLLGAVWGAGNTTMPLAAGAAHGSNFQEAVIKIVAYSSAPTGIISFALILWGLRIGGAESQHN